MPMNFLVCPIGKKVKIAYKTFFKLFQTVLIMLKYSEPEESRAIHNLVSHSSIGRYDKIQIHHQN